jgi:hypothetical protein
MQTQANVQSHFGQGPQKAFGAQNNNSRNPVNIFNQQPQNPVKFPARSQSNPENHTQAKNQAIESNDITITKVQENPLDSIQMIKWMPEQNNQSQRNCFAVCGWDGCVRVYSVEYAGSPNGQGNQILKQELECFLGEPV